MSTSRSASVVLLFVFAVLLGSGNFIAVSFSNDELDPFWGAGLRFTAASVVFVTIAWTLRLPWPRGRMLLLTGAYGIFTFALPYALLYWALTRMSAGITSVVLATVPLATLLLAAAHGLERLSTRGLTGALLAVGGIAWMTLDTGGVSAPVGGVLATLIAAAAIGESVILSKRISGSHPAVSNAVGMLVGTPVLLIASLVAGENQLLPRTTEATVAIAYLVVLGSLVLFVLTLLIVRRWTAAATSYMFVLFPVGALLMDAWLRDTQVTSKGAAGAAIIMASVWFGIRVPNDGADDGI